ncbi:hypothetical protein V6N12_047534 [Hibiscus sabdariffa]|uniref:Nodulin-like domain-containing protein n=1 Tax=Hibiscus sabdariffa TaxID=183260 RepID=A0ABR2DBI2_9ROSI
MGGVKERFQAFVNNRWLVFVVAMWIQSCTGPSYLFGSISPVIKTSLNYNQRQLSKLGVTKDLGGSVGFLAGTLSEILPFWGVLLLGALHNLGGYGWLWFIVSGKAPVLPLWAMCALIFVGTNGLTYFNTAVLVSCVQNFPKSRGPVVGILKGFSALSGAILIQIYTAINFPDQASLILMFALGPSMVVVAFMFIIRPVQVSHNLVSAFTVILFVLIFIPILLSFRQEPREPDQELLIPKTEQREARNSEDVKPEDCYRGPRIGEDFTLMQTLITTDFWLIMLSLLFGSGSGLTVIDNLGQMSQSLGYDNTHIFVSVISIWNFLGRVCGGSVSEIIVRDHAYPRLVAIAVAQLVMAVGHVFFAMGWPGAVYIGTMLIGLCYGAHWAIVPVTASELFGLKKFGALYNFLNLANPAGTLIFSSLIASGIYDREAEKQAHQHHMQPQIWGSILSGMSDGDEPPKCEGSICFFLSSMIMSGFCIIAAGLSMILVYRTKTVYARLYGKTRT